VIRLAAIHRYPVKGLQGENLTRATVARGGALPADRRFALAPAMSGIDPQTRTWQARRGFFHLARHAVLAPFAAAWRDDNRTLSITRDGRTLVEGRPEDPDERNRLSDGLAAALGLDQALTLVGGEGASFSDVPARVLSVISLASLEELAEGAGTVLDPRRFRGNLVIVGAKPWAEFGWVARVFALGTARLRVIGAIERCAATTVNPDTGERDLNVPALLQGAISRADCGVYAEVLAAGTFAGGDALMFA